ncbi:MAG: hypothetical protein H6813_04135 [Phycisphaeraceae bacterium]|nr:hypothetical protein [Phycisphaeraceae bacterium]MCB9847136.1 hypothetical protein [Phycisphaeraceae bacterium]
MFSIQNNVNSLIAQHAFAQNNIQLMRSFTKLSTGLRINSGADDPAGLIASENLRATLSHLEAESRSLERADHVVATADAALGEISELANRADELAVASANTAGMSQEEIEANQMELDSIIDSVDRIASTTTFNGSKLLDGSFSMTAAHDTFTFDSAQPNDLGATESGGETYTLSDLKSGGALAIDGGDAATAAQVLRTATGQIATARGRLGTISANTITPALNSLNVAIENITAAESFIRDTDFAFETSNLARNQILGASTLNNLGVANSQPRMVLSLLG